MPSNDRPIADAATRSDPPCPRCGMTAQVEPSRSEPGRWMCHGCAQPFDASAAKTCDCPPIEGREDEPCAIHDAARTRVSVNIPARCVQKDDQIEGVPVLWVEPATGKTVRIVTDDGMYRIRHMDDLVIVVRYV